MAFGLQLPFKTERNREKLMQYEAFKSKGTVDEWRVEAIDENNEGQVFVTIFSGPDAKQRAEEYAAWQNAVHARA